MNTFMDLRIELMGAIPNIMVLFFTVSKNLSTLFLTPNLSYLHFSNSFKAQLYQSPLSTVIRGLLSQHSRISFRNMYASSALLV